jgi:ABC-type nickel/cobalt efflux system permease component RcnA
VCKDSKSLRHIVAIMNMAWAAWALLGGTFFLKAEATLGEDTTLSIFHKYVHGYDAVGVALIICGVVSFLGICITRLQRVAAILCAVWCTIVAAWMQFATPAVDQLDIDAWLLLMCAFTCVMRWALLVLEPHVTR